MDFYKLSGAGNDFLAFAEPPREPSVDEIRAWCQRGLSLGADGVFVLRRTPGGARMAHWNSDGGRSELCLNGSRCAARLAFHLGWQARELELETDSGTLLARHVDGGRVGIVLPDIVGEPAETALELEGTAFVGWHLEVGCPHFVLPWPRDLSAVPVAALGARLRAHPDLAPRGANVSFVRFAAADRIEIRTYERGVEGETLACGTGVVAAVQAGLAAGALRLPVTALTSGRFQLVVNGEPVEGPLRRPVLVGDARLVARGELLGGAAPASSS